MRSLKTNCLGTILLILLTDVREHFPVVDIQSVILLKILLPHLFNLAQGFLDEQL